MEIRLCMVRTLVSSLLDDLSMRYKRSCLAAQPGLLAGQVCLDTRDHNASVQKMNDALDKIR